MKKTNFILLLGIFYSSSLFSQINPRMLNPNYMWTSFFDTFNTLDTSKWKVADNSPFQGGYNELGFLLIWKNSIATISVSSGDLLLSGIKYYNYTTTFNWFGNDTTVTTNFIAGSMETYEYFHYGIFECSMNCDYKAGTFPAFWLYNDSQCSVSKRTEIDIMEFKYEDPSPEINHGFFYYPTNCEPEVGRGHDQSAYSSGSHTYKCIYMPDKVEFYIDNNLKHSIIKNEDNQWWYPDMQHHIILSHQLWRYNTTAPYFGIETPQTTRFEWVSAKTFFLAPEITCPAIICTSGTAVLDVDSKADSITWSLTPTNLFSGATNGTGKTANINAAGPRGQGKITYTFKMPSNEIFTAEKTFYIGDSGFIPVIEGEPYLTCDNALFTEENNRSVTWSVYGPMEIVGQNFGYRCTIKGTGNGYGWIYATNDCGSQTGEMFVEVDCGYFLALTPNPSTGETTVSIESTSKELVIDENEEWDLEVYSDFQSLKKKDSKLQGKYYKLQTSGWKEGIYIVRVKYKDLILQEKLLVK